MRPARRSRGLSVAFHMTCDERGSNGSHRHGSNNDHSGHTRHKGVDVAQQRNTRHRHADDVAKGNRLGILHDGAVAVFVCDSLGADELLLGIDLVRLMRGDNSRALSERHRVAGLDACGIGVAHVDERAHGELGLHTARKHGIRGEAHQTDPRECHNQQQKYDDDGIRKDACDSTHRSRPDAPLQVSRPHWRLVFCFPTAPTGTLQTPSTLAKEW